MNFPNKTNAQLYTKTSHFDAGLRSYMLGVYLMMATGLVVSALAALGFSTLTTTNDVNLAVAHYNGMMLTQLGATVYLSPFKYVLIFAPLALVFFMQFSLTRLSANTARNLFLVFSLLFGLSLSSIFLTYTQTSITQVFVITSASFACLSLYGYTTKKDLSGLGTFLLLSLFGIIIASLVNIFLVQSSFFQFIISIAGVLVFSGLTAYDTQRVKAIYHEFDESEQKLKKITIGALTLYLDFINLFIFLLQLIGVKKD
ncbi:Bax inhibitor-1/YccA family protein [Bartonella sp. DGB1]|uniref:Bax inhibitor-1/YccA family protein n=1 Tax=Bartonella sp. DGB1 TaxID=3239807 RepID=UPI003523B4FF